mgnify:CR=1 FL=1
MAGTPKRGESRSPEYRAWQTMRLRCTDPSNAAFPSYGGRGITICDRWMQSVSAFIEDMGRKPTPLHEIDRIDNDRGYEPSNCRWATRKENSRNRRSSRILTVNGETLTVAEWAERSGISHSTITKRLAAGWSEERAVQTPVGPSGPGKPCVGAIMADAAPRRRMASEFREAAE